MILLKITLELTMILQNIWGGVVGNVVINITPSNIFPKMRLIEKYIRNCQACFGLFECEWVNGEYACFWTVLGSWNGVGRSKRPAARPRSVRTLLVESLPDWVRVAVWSTIRTATEWPNIVLCWVGSWLALYYMWGTRGESVELIPAAV